MGFVERIMNAGFGPCLKMAGMEFVAGSLNTFE
jgi:hypothetical protein